MDYRYINFLEIKSSVERDIKLFLNLNLKYLNMCLLNKKYFLLDIKVYLLSLIKIYYNVYF